MKSITQASEIRINKMIKLGSKWGEELLEILDQLKSRESCLGAKIKEMKSWGIEIDANNEVTIYVTNRMRGMSAVFQELFNAVDCQDLHYVSFEDFNKLVKACYDDSFNK